MIAGVLFNDGWSHPKIIQLHKKLCNAVIDQAEKVLPRAKNFYLDTTWFDGYQHHDRVEIDNLFLFGMIDPSLDARAHSLAWYTNIKDPTWPDLADVNDYDGLADHIKKEITETFGIDVSQFHGPLTTFCSRSKKIVEMGYTERPDSIAIDFWAICMLNLFSIPDVSQVRFNFDPGNLFLCYQHKPHLHRQYLKHLVDHSDCRDKGIITLSQPQTGTYLYPGLEPAVDPHSQCWSYASDDMEQASLTLGDLQRWQNSFLIITSETVSNRVSCFLSEKTYKPIIGLRPFVINGGPKIYQWLEKFGFDTFEDLWPTVDLRSHDGYENHCKKIMSIVQYVCDHTPDQIRSWYQSLMPRLVRNREQFYRHAMAQQKLVYEDSVQSINRLDLC
jgi:hypothetical protein